MPALETAMIVLAAIALLAAFVNGAIGYGFSSLTVPVALVFLTNRILNPAIVLVEVFLNLFVLFTNREGVPAVWRRVFPIRATARHCRWGVCSCFSSARLDQIRHLHCYSASHPFSGGRLAEAASVELADRSPVRNGSGRPVFGN